MTTNFINAAIQTSHDGSMRMIMADYANGARNTYFMLGPPGVGKTTLGRNLAEATGLPLVFIHAPTTLPESISIPVPDHNTGTTRDYINEQWGLHHDGPVILFIDEYTKASPIVQNILHTALEHPRRIGNRMLHPDSIVICTGNNPSVGVGDVLRAHTRNRVTLINFKSPTAAEWMLWGAGQVHGYVLSFAEQNAGLFLSYTDPEFQSLDTTDPMRQMVFNPSPDNPARGESYVSPRSLEAASNWVWSWERSQGTAYAMTLDDLTAALQGVIGVPAAEKLKAVIRMGDDVPSPAKIMAHAEAGTLKGLHRPGIQPAQMMMCLNAPHWLSGAAGGVDKPKTRVEVQQRITAWFDYMEGGFTVPVISAFLANVQAAASKSVSKESKIHKLWEVMTTNPNYSAWARKYNHII